MNDQDEKAFQEWNNLPMDQIFVPEKYCEWIDSGKDTMDFFIKIAWQAGCRHKQKEVDDLRDRLTHEVDMIDGAAKDHVEILETEIDKWKTAYKREAEDHSVRLNNLQKEIDHLSNCIEQIGKRLFPFSGYTEIGKILEEIKAINEIYKQNAKPESN